MRMRRRARSISGIGGGSPQGTQVRSKNFELKTEDFIKMMITQLQNQDPMEPAKNEELLAQMSQIGQLQSSTTAPGEPQGDGAPEPDRLGRRT